MVQYRGRGILADFEYAKKFDPKPTKEASSDPKTGTAFFMAIEIQTQRWLYQPKPLRVRDANESSPPPMIHNHQHDGESLLWVVLWTYIVRLLRAPPSEVPDAAPQRRHTVLQRAIANIFRNDGGCERDHEEALTRPDDFARRVLDVAFPRKDWDAPGMETYMTLSEVLRSALVQFQEAYNNRQYATDDIPSYCSVYVTLSDTFTLLRNHYDACSNKYPSLHSRQLSDDAQTPPSLPVRKRSRQSEDDEDYCTI
ncbi:hypothetical protein C8Q76DRAFT_845036 [Earliella scabrosa]|nr:hypothetical protein C8Q76DRAFT_845036 [Earliella scabrosa]